MSRDRTSEDGRGEPEGDVLGSAAAIRVRQRLGVVDGAVVIACSGGADSTWLTTAAKGVARGVIHVQHHARAAAQHDEAMVRCLCRYLDLPVVVVHVPGHAPESMVGGPEAGLRRLRYEAFHWGCSELAGRLGVPEACVNVATAHTADDNFEQLMIALSRGDGLKGLRGIPEGGRVFDVDVIRPMLDVERVEIERELQSAGIAYVHDASNDDPRYLRNRVRATLTRPFLELAGASGAVRAQRHLRDAAELLEKYLARDLERAGLAVAADEVRVSRSSMRGAAQSLTDAAGSQAVFRTSEKSILATYVKELFVRLGTRPTTHACERGASIIMSGSDQAFDAPGARFSAFGDVVTVALSNRLNKQRSVLSAEPEPMSVRDAVELRAFEFGSYRITADVIDGAEAEALASGLNERCASSRGRRSGPEWEDVQCFELDDAVLNGAFVPVGAEDIFAGSGSGRTCLERLKKDGVGAEQRRDVVGLRVSRDVVWLVGHRRARLRLVTAQSGTVLRVQAVRSGLPHE